MALQRQLIVSFVSTIAMVIATLCGGSSALKYWVGDSVWSIPPYPNYYSEWSSSHRFYTADSLVFDFETEFYNLMQVPILDYQNCNANNPVKVLNAGPATILLNQPGVFYFLCNLSNYCDLGQRISIIVHDKNSPSPSPSPVPPSAPPPSSLSSAPLGSPEPSPGNWNESESPGPGSEAPSPSAGDLGLHMKSCGTSSSGLISLAGFCFAMNILLYRGCVIFL